MTEIKINNLEEIAVGKIINGETIISHKDNSVETVIERAFDGTAGILRRKYDYVLFKDNTLIKIGDVEISERKYNYYLNLIKQPTN